MLALAKNNHFTNLNALGNEPTPEDLWEYSTFEDVPKRIPYFIDAVYNQKRLHSAFGYVSPDEFEAELFDKEQKIEFCQFSLT